MPRRTRPSTRTTAIRASIRRAAPTDDTPTLALTAVEIDSMQSAAAASAPLADADATPTVESLRLAPGSSSIAPAAERPTPPEASQPVTSRPAARAPEVTPPVATRALSPIRLRGPRRTREALRADELRDPPPNRKR